MPGGELPVPGGDAVIVPITQLLREQASEIDLVVFSRDWHPADHCSFSETPAYSDGSWPAHGLAGTASAEVHPELIAQCASLGIEPVIISKGTDRDREAYSAFDGCALERGIGLDAALQDAGVREVIIVGLAGEICVAATVADAIRHGYEVTLMGEGIGFLGDPAPALDQMRRLGARIDDPGARPV